MAQLQQKPATTWGTVESSGSLDLSASNATGSMGNAAAVESLLGTGGAMGSLFGGFLPLMSGTPYEDPAEANLRAAQEELGAKLQVGEGEGMVSQAEYDHMLATYAAIRSGDSHLIISDMGMDPEQAEKFRTDTLDTLTTMMQTESGRLLIDHLANQSGAEGEKKDIILSNGLASFEEVGGEKRAIGNRCIARDDKAASGGKSGTGSAVFWANEDRTLKGSDGRDMAMPKDAVLFHELTHALHNLRGDRDDSDVEADDGVERDHLRGVGREEHQAAGLGMYEGDYLTENTYREQRRALAANLPEAERARIEELYRRRDEYALDGGARPALHDTTGMQQYGEGGWPVKP